jgi:hypothetical protein
MMIPVPPSALRRFTKEQIEDGVRVMFWTHPPKGFEVAEDPSLDWSEDYLSNVKVVRARGAVVSCN